MCKFVSHCRKEVEVGVGEVGVVERGRGLLGKLANDSNERSILVL